MLNVKRKKRKISKWIPQKICEEKPICIRRFDKQPVPRPTHQPTIETYVEQLDERRWTIHEDGVIFKSSVPRYLKKNQIVKDLYGCQFYCWENLLENLRGVSFWISRNKCYCWQDLAKGDFQAPSYDFVSAAIEKFLPGRFEIGDNKCLMVDSNDIVSLKECEDDDITQQQWWYQNSTNVLEYIGKESTLPQPGLNRKCLDATTMTLKSCQPFNSLDQRYRSKEWIFEKKASLQTFKNIQNNKCLTTSSDNQKIVLTECSQAKATRIFNPAFTTTPPASTPTKKIHESGDVVFRILS